MDSCEARRILMININLVIVYLTHIQFNCTITEIFSVSVMYVWQICIMLSLLIYIQTV